MTAPSPIIPIMSGKQCIGFTFKRGPIGYKAWNSNNQSLGLFPDKESAAAAVIEAHRQA